MASSIFAAFLKDPKPIAGAFVRRYHVALGLIVFSTLLTSLMMRESEITIIILAAYVALLWLAVSVFKQGRTGVWLVIVAEILSATQMRPNRATVFALILNLTLMLGAIIAARLGAAEKDA